MKEKLIKIPLREVKKASRNSRAEKAINKTRNELSKHFRVEKDQIYLDKSINEEIWKRGIQKPPTEIRVRARKFDDGVVEAEVAQE